MSKHYTHSEGTGLHGRTVAVALDLLEEAQARRPELDQIAQVLNVDVATIRQIFPDDQAVLAAAAEQALMRLMDTCTKAVVKVDPDDAVAQFLALGEAYIEWATTYRAQFRLLSDDRILDVLKTPHLRRYLDSLRELMLRMLERARDAGHLAPDENLPLMVLSSRTFAYGLARMVIDGRMQEWYTEAPPLEAAKMALHDFVRRIARGSLRSIRAEERRAENAQR